MDIATAIGFIAVLSVFLAVALAIANSKLKVQEDPRIGRVEEMLPGANCGACGLPGCRAFAENVVAGKILPGQCPVGGPETARMVAEYLGVDAGQTVKKVARLLCAGNREVAPQIAEYDGYPSCRAAAAVTGGFKGCVYGCLGLGDCVASCTFDAMFMAPNGLPMIDVEKCTGCGDCVRACPKGIIELYPISQHLIVQCKSLLAGDDALAVCEVACTGCGICAADAPEGLITMQHHLPIVHQDRLSLETELATLRCPTGAITWVEGQQFPELFYQLKTAKQKAKASRVV